MNTNMSEIGQELFEPTKDKSNVVELSERDNVRTVAEDENTEITVKDEKNDKIDGDEVQGVCLEGLKEEIGGINGTTETETSAKEKENSAKSEKEQDTRDVEETWEHESAGLEMENKGSSEAPMFSRVNSLYQVRSMAETNRSDRGPVFISSPDLRKTVLEDNAPRARRQVTSGFLLGGKRNNRVAAVVAQPRSLLVVSPHTDLREPAKEATVSDNNTAENADDDENVNSGEDGDHVILKMDSGAEGDDVMIDQAPAGSSSGIVTYSAGSEESAEARIEPESSLQRRMSLNPRLMCPPGLDVLKNKGMLVVRQQIHADIADGCGAPNSYMIRDLSDQQIFFAGEASSCFCRWFCGPNRGFNLELFSAQEDLVLSLHRSSCRCDCWCCLDCFMCLHKLYVTDCLGRTLGAIKQKFSILSAKFDIVDHDNNVLFKIQGPYCPCRCCTEIFFRILDNTGVRPIGRIQKKWGGDRADNVNVDHEYFDIRFPVRLESVDKALIIAAGFLVNYMYFEMS